MDPTPIETLLGNIGSFFTSAFGWVGSIIDFVVARPALLILVVAMPIVGFAFGLLRRLVRM